MSPKTLVLLLILLQLALICKGAYVINTERKCIKSNYCSLNIAHLINLCYKVNTTEFKYSKQSKL